MPATLLITISSAFDPSTITGDYTEYIWSDGVHYWYHVVGYATYTNAGGQTVHQYISCETRTVRI